MFLDEIGDLSIQSQVKLLRLLQEGKYYPVGSDVAKLTDARILVATNKDIESMQEAGEFRKDLFYRLQAHHIHVPPLRERKEDISLLVGHFLEKASNELGRKKPTPPQGLFTLLLTYHFPGNIRELEGMVFDALSRHKSGVLSMKSFSDKVAPKHPSPQESAQEVLVQAERMGVSFAEQLPTLKETEEMLIAEALRRSNGNQTIAAQMLGLTRRALNNRLSRAQE